ncbi:MAG: phosphatidylglycerol lysyltransferase domain-containing protein [Kofleriaceae bacterium]
MERARVLELLRAHGWNATSFQILEPGFQYFFAGDAVVGYVDTGSAWVAAGAPIAPPERVREVSDAFVAAAKQAGRRASCFGTEERFSEITQWPAMRIGDQPVWNPASWAEVVKSRKSLREQLRRARAKGVVVRAVGVDELAPGTELRAQIDELITRWQASRPIAPMGFLVQIDPFTFVEERRYFVAEREGHVVAFLGIIPIFARGGWFFEDFLRDPEAPNGTIELLVDAGMRAAAEEGVPFVTLGLVPLAGDVKPWLRATRKLGRALYDFDGLRAFKAKFEPSGWDPIYLAHPPRTSSMVALFDTLRAFARGGLLRFGLETFLRGPAIVVRAIAALLVVWTILLALPIGARFFPSHAWQYGWVAFDVALAASLFVLARRWTRPLANVVAGAVTLDAIATVAQGLLYNVPRRAGPFDLVVIAIAMLAPTLAALMLWNARAVRAG